MPDHLELHGCRHDILGHYLKAIGLLRVLAKCADEGHRDTEAEGWWDNDKACFCLRSPKYPSREKLVEFFACHYKPTVIFAAWNGDPGSDANKSERLGVQEDWKIANNLSVQVDNTKNRKTSPSPEKLIATGKALEAYREIVAPSATEALDSVASSFLKSNEDNPLFLAKGIAGRAHIFRTHWNYLSDFQKLRSARERSLENITVHERGDNKLAALVEKAETARLKMAAHNGTTKKLTELAKKAEAAQQKVADHQTRRRNELAELKAKLKDAEQALADLVPTESGCASAQSGIGTPFFPDAIKAYNIGSGWKAEEYPINALDYILAVEGGFAMRGSIGRTLAASSKRFAAFPFVFDAGEDLVNKDGETNSTASALWFPLWDRRATFAELSGFITDAQARLPGKEARFSAEFMRALHSQGVDAGFTGWQEFRFKQRVTDVPWITTGAYVESAFREDATRLSRALHPLDEAGFLDQFEMKRAGRNADSRSPHPIRSAINAAMETAMRETTPHHCLDLLCDVFRACRQMAISESFRETLPKEYRNRPRFFRPLPMEHWNHLLRDMDQPEFRIARAVASITNGGEQLNGEYSKVLPMLGSLLPLKLGQGGWYLPKSEDKNHQAVWTGADLYHDLTAVLARRYMDSLKDEYPALIPPRSSSGHDSFGARLSDVLAFLSGDLDDALTARWIEGLSLIGWEFAKEATDATTSGEPEFHAIPPEYAALRTLLELECERHIEGNTKKRRSQQPIALLCQRSASTLPLAVMEALRWVSIWGVPNPYENKVEKERLAGRDIISPRSFSPSTAAARLAAAVCIPLHWRDRRALYRAVSLPQGD